MHRPHLLPLAALCAAALLAGCSPVRPHGAGNSRAVARPAEGLILQAGEGERRVRRPRPGSTATLTAPFILKVDRAQRGLAGPW